MGKSQSKDYSKAEYISFWGEKGYVETWDGFGHNWSQTIMNFVIAQIGTDKSKVVLEVGCGAGYWTKMLCEHSQMVHAIDILPSLELPYDNFRYYENDDQQYDCKSIPSQSIDFVFSFGVFCHFSQKACIQYIKDIKRVLKPNCCAILMFADQKGMNSFYGKEVSLNSVYGSAVNYQNAESFLVQHFPYCHKLLDFRDGLFLIKK